MNWMNFSSFLKNISKCAVQFIGGWVTMLNFLVYFDLLRTFAFLVAYCDIIQQFSFQLIMKLHFICSQSTAALCH